MEYGGYEFVIGHEYVEMLFPPLPIITGTHMHIFCYIIE